MLDYAWNRQIRPASVLLKKLRLLATPTMLGSALLPLGDVAQGEAQGLVKAVADVHITLWYLVTILWLKFPDESLAKCYETLRSRTPLINVNICTNVQAMFVTSSTSQSIASTLFLLRLPLGTYVIPYMPSGYLQNQ